MPNYLKVSNLENNTSWEKHLSHDEYLQAIGTLEGKNTVALIPATFKAVRDDNWKNFSKDFFLPTTVNRAIKVGKLCC